jgi:protein-L-isoaspartate O-methyltransferase
MREIARVAQGYFPTQSSIVAAIACLLNLPQHGTVTVLDAGCGCGEAIANLRSALLSRASQELSIKLYGIESDRERHRQANTLLSSTGGEALWSPIEDSTVDGGASLLWFNPPYDRIRGAGRAELSLFNHVKNWCRRQGIMVMIVPDYVLDDEHTGLALAVERCYSALGVFRYPDPEYKIFNQCVFIGTKRERTLTGTYVDFPAWARDSDHWPILGNRAGRKADIPVGISLKLRRSSLSDELIRQAADDSPLRNSLLAEALAPSPYIERPLLPLKAGHLALALAGGLCDGVVEHEGVRFLLKGTLERKTCQTKTTERFDAKGRKTADVDVFRTVYVMNVRCLRDDGTIEEYSSNNDENSSADTNDL